MGSKYPIDLTGMKFYEFTVIKEAEPKIYSNGKKTRRYECVCSCGNRKILYRGNLTSGDTKSCGCMHTYYSKISHTTHGESNTRLHGIWNRMKMRCHTESDARYRLYGGRGITVCEEWRNSYEAFRDWSHKNGYSDELSIDRIDNNGPYAPWNCRWATAKEQNNNKRTNHYVTIGKETHTIREWSKIYGIKYSTISERLRHGWNERDAVCKPAQKRTYK